MSPELELRGLHQPHEPDPAFVDALEQRLDAILAGKPLNPAPLEDGAALDLYLPATATPPAPRRWVFRVVLGAAAAIVIVAVGVFIRRDGPASVETPIAPIVRPRANGWVAQGFGSGIFLLREGEDDFLVDYAGRPTRQACPAFSPDGERLMIGGSTIDGGDASLEVVSVAADGTEVTRGLDGQLHPPVSLLSTIPLEGVEGTPCAIWSPDGRWAALGGNGEVLVVDTETGGVRRLPGYHPADLEWRPGTDELAMTGDGGLLGVNAPIAIYTVSTDEVRAFADVEAAELTWSPDGSTLAFTRAVAGANDMRSGITLIDADGTNSRSLVTHAYPTNDGIGVVWSPRGDQIAYQRARARCTATEGFECSEVVLVTATDADPDTPIGTERVLPPVVDSIDPSREAGYNHPPRAGPWHAGSITWSPDGTELLYSAEGEGLMTVPVDGARPAIVLSGDFLLGANDDLATTPWIPLQQWQPVP